MGKQNERGYTAVWVVVIIALIALAISSIELTVDDRPKNPTMLWVFGISAFVAAVGLFIEAKRDL